MNARRDDSDSALEKIGARVRQRALTGTEASTVGFILVVYIGAFAGLGYWLDTLFKTSWIVAVGVLLGFAIGFREMFRMAQKLGRESIVEDQSNARASLNSTLSAARATKVEAAPDLSTQTVEAARERPRIFSVPAPPDASFDKAKVKREEPSTAPDDEFENESNEELIERLLEKDDPDATK